MKQDIIDHFFEKYPVSKSEEISNKLNKEINSWEDSTQSYLNQNNPFAKSQFEFSEARKSFNKKNYSLSAIESDYSKYQEFSKLTNSNINQRFWNKEIEKLKTQDQLNQKFNTSKKKSTKELKLTRKLLHNNWEKLLNQEFQKWELNEIEKRRKKILDKIENWLELIQKLQDLIDGVSLGYGLLFDSSIENLTNTDIDQLQKWVNYISNNKEIKELCDLLGRLRTIDKSSRKERIQTTKHITQIVKDYNSKEEITGIKIGNDLEHVLPQELALLRDEETSILFDKKYVESELMCFDLEGTTQQSIHVEEEDYIETKEKDKLGPMIICVDTSGSMKGSPEIVAKAISLALATRAKEQDRECLIINFSTSIETFELSGELGIKQLFDFLKLSFHGGTDVTPAIEFALNKMTKKSYQKADLLVVSDFIMPSLDKELGEKITMMKKEKNKFYSLSIGDLFLDVRMKNLFDDQWVYNPETTSIQQIQNISETIIN